jgi:hypothetical protein
MIGPRLGQKQSLEIDSFEICDWGFVIASLVIGLSHLLQSQISICKSQVTWNLSVLQCIETNGVYDR